MAGQDWQLGSFTLARATICLERRDTRRKRLLSSDRGHPSLHVFASRLHLGSQLCLREREGRRILLVVPPKAVVEKSRSASGAADSLSRRLARPSFLPLLHASVADYTVFFTA